MIPQFSGSERRADRSGWRAPSALEIAEGLRAGRLSSTTVTRHYLAAIEAANPKLSAFVSTLGGRARRGASRWRRRETQPVLAGVPVGIKDLDPVFLSFVRAGSRAMRYVLAPFDAESVKRIRAGGMLLLGKTATSELAILPVTEPDIHPPTRNPWNLDHSAGGSSGGAAAAVAAGLCPIAHASDGAGSTRIPAAFCHLFGFKPSRDHVPNFYAADRLGLSCTGCVCHTVADAAAFLDVLCGRPHAHRDPQSWLHRHRERPKRLRVRAALASPLVRGDPEILSIVEAGLRTIQRLGHRVSAGPALAVGEVDEFIPLMSRQVANVPVLSRDLLQPLTAWMHRQGALLSNEESFATARGLERRVLDWFGDVDLVATPTVALPPPRIGEFSGLDPETLFRAASRLGAFTAPFNLSGQPAASVPLGVTAAGLPVGLQIVGPRGEDVLVLQVAHEIEEAAPWRDRHAPQRVAPLWDAQP